MGSEQTQAWDARGPGGLLFKGAPLTRRAAGPRAHVQPGGAGTGPEGQPQPVPPGLPVHSGHAGGTVPFSSPPSTPASHRPPVHLSARPSSSPAPLKQARSDCLVSSASTLCTAAFLPSLL